MKWPVGTNCILLRSCPGWMHNALFIREFAISLALLVGADNSQSRLPAAHVSRFRTDHTLTAAIDHPSDKYALDAQVAAFCSPSTRIALVRLASLSSVSPWLGVPLTACKSSCQRLMVYLGVNQSAWQVGVVGGVRRDMAALP
jgi:hypothetical protein